MTLLIELSCWVTCSIVFHSNLLPNLLYQLWYDQNFLSIILVICVWRHHYCTIGVHESLALSSLLLILCIDTITADFYHSHLWCFLYNYDIFLISECCIESQIFGRCTMTSMEWHKTEYMECGPQINYTIHINDEECMLSTKYLGYVVH